MYFTLAITKTSRCINVVQLYVHRQAAFHSFAIIMDKIEIIFLSAVNSNLLIVALVYFAK
jgi:hypothetical protein